MFRFLPHAALLSILASSALAGPPLVCHPWIPEDAPRPPSMSWLDDGAAIPEDWEAEAVRALDAAAETLVRMDIVQRALIRLSDSAGKGRFLAALDDRVRRAEEAARGAAADRAAAARLDRCRFDHSLAVATARYLGGERASRQDEAASVARLKACAAALGDDPAALLAVARATTPLMRTGTREEHAQAFVRAYDLAAGMPEGEGRKRMQSVLAWDLERLEAYLLDAEIQKTGAKPGSESRLATLRTLARASEVAEDELNRFIFLAVFEGLMSDSVPDDVVEQVLHPKGIKSNPARDFPNFVYACPICSPAVEAFRAWAGRRSFYYGRKGDPYVSECRLPEDIRASLFADAAAERRAGIQKLVGRFVVRRFETLRLNDAELARWREAIARASKRGAELLKSQHYDTQDGMEKCPSCEGAISGREDK
ncbi:MAG: hypothetical protein FD180_4998 [Planctomycetota bacterium]|nr:MAG: hypothetical protein FD180_4998 [Planctomycetota bacterium]